MSLEKRVEDLEKATEGSGRGLLSVFPKDCDSEVTDVQVEEAVRSYGFSVADPFVKKYN